MGMGALLLMEEILHQLRLVVYPIIYKVFYIPGGAGFLPSTVRAWGSLEFPLRSSVDPLIVQNRFQTFTKLEPNDNNHSNNNNNNTSNNNNNHNNNYIWYIYQIWHQQRFTNFNTKHQTPNTSHHLRSVDTPLKCHPKGKLFELEKVTPMNKSKKPRCGVELWKILRAKKRRCKWREGPRYLKKIDELKWLFRLDDSKSWLILTNEKLIFHQTTIESKPKPRNQYLDLNTYDPWPRIAKMLLWDTSATLKFKMKAQESGWNGDPKLKWPRTEKQWKHYEHLLWYKKNHIKSANRQTKGNFLMSIKKQKQLLRSNSCPSKIREINMSAENLAENVQPPWNPKGRQQKKNHTEVFPMKFSWRKLSRPYNVRFFSNRSLHKMHLIF